MTTAKANLPHFRCASTDDSVSNELYYRLHNSMTLVLKCCYFIIRLYLS